MDQYLPLSYLNHLAYCPRRFWYMYVQGEIAINAPMLEGTYLHNNRAHQPGLETDRHGRPVYRRIWVWSDRLKIAGFTDFVEEDAGKLIPVEYKHGKKREWENDQIQLCAQAICLEEMTGSGVTRGEIFYWRSRRRVTVSFDESLRQLCELAVAEAYTLLTRGGIPSPTTEKQKCPHCSIKPICLPEEVFTLNQESQLHV